MVLSQKIFLVVFVGKKTNVEFSQQTNNRWGLNNKKFPRSELPKQGVVFHVGGGFGLK